MKYHALEVTFDNENFHDITKEDWNFNLHYIDTPHGLLELETVDIRDKGSMVGLEFSTEGYFSIGDFSDFKGDDRTPYITKVAVLRQPHNVWLWIYMFDENDQQVAVFCGYDDLDGLKHYIDEIIEYTDENFDEDGI